jgi:hypothetical protein
MHRRPARKSIRDDAFDELYLYIIAENLFERAPIVTDRTAMAE